MNIAYTMAPGRGDTDLMLSAVARTLQGQGYNPAGVVQVNSERADDGPCDMDVLVLPQGPTFRISQNLGRNSKGCRLDPDALETAVGLVAARLVTGADCLIINKFGKHEAEGRGFRAVIAEALGQDIPVLVGLNPLNAPAFLDFVGDMAIELPAAAQDLQGWLVPLIKGRRQAA